MLRAKHQCIAAERLNRLGVDAFQLNLLDAVRSLGCRFWTGPSEVRVCCPNRS